MVVKEARQMRQILGTRDPLVAAKLITFTNDFLGTVVGKNDYKELFETRLLFQFIAKVECVLIKTPFVEHNSVPFAGLEPLLERESSVKSDDLGFGHQLLREPLD